MTTISQMQGVSAHLETLKTTDGNRRHSTHCIYADGKGKNRKCTSPQCARHNQSCHSAARCDYYEEQN